MAIAIAKAALASHCVLFIPCRISPALHFAVPETQPTAREFLRIRGDILLQIQIIQQIEICVHLVIVVQSLEIAYCGTHGR